MLADRQIVRMGVSKVKSRIGEALGRVMHGQFVVITKHGSPKAAIISIAEFEKLTQPNEPQPDLLGGLSQEYDAMLARMQTPEARRQMKAAFDASPNELAQAALRFACKHFR